MSEAYFRGAVMAYTDCADYVEHQMKKLPPDVRSTLAPVYDAWIEGFRLKAEEVKKHQALYMHTSGSA